MNVFIKHLIYILILFSGVNQAVAQNWSFVGPRSTNRQPYNGNPNLFETAQFNWIIQDPNNSTHFFAGGKFAGLWESSNDGANWTRINTFATESGGISYANFISSTEILVGTAFEDKVTSGKVSKYNFSTQTWTLLAALPNPNNYKINIKDVDVDPANANVYFVSTSIGLFRGVWSGSSVTWTNVCQGFIENMEFAPGLFKGTYKYYIAGSDNQSSYLPQGTILFNESNNGTGFVPVNVTYTYNGSYTYTNTHALLCKGTTSAGSHDMHLQIYARRLSSGAEVFDTYLNKVTFSSMSPAYTNLTPSGILGNTNALYHPNRSALVYDPTHNGLYYGGVRINFFNISTGVNITSIRQSFNTTSGNIHDDMHDFKIYSVSGTNYIYVAHDGGIAKSPIPVSTPTSGSAWTFTALNNDLHVTLVNGFSSSATNPDLYLVGGQDIVYTDIYDASLGVNTHTIYTWENDGGLIDKFDEDHMVLDASSYNTNYQTTVDGGQTVSGTYNFYEPNTTAPFESSGTLIYGPHQQAGQGFQGRQYYQDPFRPGRIFYGKHLVGIYQLDHNNLFVKKLDTRNLTSTPGQWSGGWAGNHGMSFSPETPNSMHFIVNGDMPTSGIPGVDVPMVIKYIGDNLDDCWIGHNEYQTTSGQPQWANLTQNLWLNITSQISNCSGCVNLNTTTQYDVELTEIETSPWNKNVIYVLLTVPNNPQIKVLKYNGSSWSNYSTGIPNGETPIWMTMDYGSYDAIYVGTQTGNIYYRNANQSSWSSYNDGNFPKLRISQLDINYQDNTLRAGTYGLGIWKTPLVCPTVSNPVNNGAAIPSTIFEGINIIASKNTLQNTGPTAFRGTNSVTLNPGFIAVGSATANRYVKAFIHGCNTPGSSEGLKNGSVTVEDGEVLLQEQIESFDFTIYPNPSEGHFSLKFEAPVEGKISITTLDGKSVFTEDMKETSEHKMDLSSIQSGVYIITLTKGTKSYSKRIIKN
jgi:hypothetical protein